jgi:DNA (cytosine-5)-methyltransferase 1
MTEKHNWDMIKLEIRANTKAGSEIATEGDAINFSVPSSSTSRGRVGKQIAQTLDTQSNQGVIVPAPPFVVAQRGRNKTNPSDRTAGIELEQRLEPNNTGKANTLTSVEKDNYLVDNRFQIRRLTEIECERLQGFPDNWTKYGSYEGVVKPISKTNRYKQCGNAVTATLPQILGMKLKQLYN